MDIKARLKQIEEHFNALTVEQLEENLIKAGIERITSSSNANMKLATEEEIKREMNNFTYSTSGSLLDGFYTKSEYNTFSFPYCEVA
jgi:hypothetical protein